MRRVLPTAMALSLLATFSLGATTADRSGVAGSARTSMQLLELGVTNVNGSTSQADLGQLQLISRRDGTPWASMELVAAALAGQQAAGWSATTTDRPERSGNVSAPFPQVRGVAAELQLVDYLLLAQGAEARSALSGLRGELGISPLALTLANSGPALLTEVADRSTAGTSLAIGAVELTLGDLLPPALLEELPLGVVIDLLATLPVSIPTVEDLLTTVEEIITDLEEITQLRRTVKDFRTELNALVGDAPGVAAAEQAVAAAEAMLADAAAALQAAIGQRTTARSALTSARSALDSALADAGANNATLQAALDAAKAAETTAKQAVTTAQSKLTSANQQLTSATAALTAAVAEQQAAQALVDSLTTQLASVTAAITYRQGLENELATLTAKLVKTASDLARIAEITAELLTLSTLSELTSEQTSLQSQLTAAQSDLATKTAAVTAATTAKNTAQSAVTSAQSALTTAQSQLTAAQKAVADAEAALGAVSPAVAAAQQAVGQAQAALTAAEQTVTTARAAVTTAEGALADATALLDRLVEETAELLGETTRRLLEELTRLQGELHDLLQQVTSHAVSLPDLSELLAQLRATLAGVPVVSMEGVSLDIHLAADDRRGTAEVVCSIGAISVLGQTLSSPTCGEAAELIGLVPEVVSDLLATLSIGELPSPQVSGLRMTTAASDGPDAHGVTRAYARVTGLALRIPSVSLSGLSDQLTARLDVLLTDALAAARSLPTGGLGLAAAGGMTTQALSTTEVLSTIGDLRTQLDGLPLGSQLDGLRTLGIDVTVGHLAAEVLNGATSDGPLELGSPFAEDDPTAPSPVPGGGDPAPAPGGDPAPGGGDPNDPRPSLPTTGGGLAALPLALLGGALLLGRRRTG